MDDLVYLAIFLACCAASVALVWVCDRLAPRTPNRSTGGTS